MSFTGFSNSDFGLPVGLSSTDEGVPLSTSQSLAPAASPTSAPSIWQELGESAALNIPGLGPLVGAGQAASSYITGGNSGSISSWFGLRGVTLLLGFLLIAAGLFAHSGVRETIISTGKKVGEAAAVAA